MEGRKIKNPQNASWQGEKKPLCARNLQMARIPPEKGEIIDATRGMCGKERHKDVMLSIMGGINGI